MTAPLLTHGGITVVGRHPNASNQVFVVDVEFEAQHTRAIYKPTAGERPLWDFPRGELARREVAAFAVAEALGLHFVPTTVWREDAPFGPGSLQTWIDGASVDDVDVVPVGSASDGWLPVLEAELSDGTAVTVVHRDRDELRTVALFDAIVNNGDRKAGHLLRDPQQRLWLVDHGVTFHTDPKLRTVLWGFAGTTFTSEERDLLEIDVSGLAALHDALDEAELAALRERVNRLREQGCFPGYPEGWPAIPWPVF